MYSVDDAIIIACPLRDDCRTVPSSCWPPNQANQLGQWICL